MLTKTIYLLLCPLSPASCLLPRICLLLMVLPQAGGPSVVQQLQTLQELPERKRLEWPDDQVD
jgi:hypothetical protein